MPRAETEPGLKIRGPSLRRNQACRQCRKKKLKCDATHPVCANCVRSHAAAVKSGNINATPTPVCTYDEPKDFISSGLSVKPSAEMDREGSGVEQLEHMLEAHNITSIQPHAVSSSAQCANLSTPLPRLQAHALNSCFSQHIFMGSLTPSQLAVVHDYQKIPDLGGLHALAEAAQSSMSINNSSDSSSPPLDVSGSTSSSSSTPTELQWLSWPPDLPSPHILAKLVEVFFNSVPLASRLLHRPTFMLSLSLNPTSSKFPGRHLLHSICAVASVHAAMVLNELPYSGGAEVNTPYAWERHRSGKTESFGEFHARRTKELTEEMEQSGDRIFEGVQATIVLSWYHYRMARWVDIWVTCGQALRYGVPAGLATSVCYASLTSDHKLDSLLPEVSSSTEAETRIQTWWCAYTMERLQSLTCPWPTCIADEDVTTFFPIKYSDFEAEINSTGHRQLIQDADIFISHPRENTDSFTLYIKAGLLISRIRSFNIRHRVRNRAQSGVDPRNTSNFQTLDDLVVAFIERFPKEFRDPFKRNEGLGSEFRVDPILLVAHSAAHAAVIILHFPHINYKSLECPSAAKSLRACRSILDHVDTLLATSFDYSLLDPTTSISWFMATRTLLQFTKARALAGDYAATYRFRTEAERIRMALVRMGEKIPMAYRQEKMIQDILFDIDDASVMSPHTGYGTVWHPVFQPGAAVKEAGPEFHKKSYVPPLEPLIPAYFDTPPDQDTTSVAPDKPFV